MNITTEVLNSYKNKVEWNLLHDEMHKLKNKIEVAKLNNQNYHDHEARLDEILHLLGYGNPKRQETEKGFRNFREVPTKGKIKIYHGGRGG